MQIKQLFCRRRPHGVEDVTDISCSTLTAVSAFNKSAGWETKGARAPNTHLGLVTDSARIHSLGSHRHSGVCRRTHCSLQNKANARSDCSLSKAIIFPQKILVNSKQPSLFLTEDWKAGSETNRTNRSCPGSYVAPLPPQTTQRMGQQKRWLCPCPLHLTGELCPPSGPHSGTARPRELSAAARAAGERAGCALRQPLRGALNYNPICSTNRRGPERWTPPWLQNSQRRQTGGVCVADRPTDQGPRPDLAGDELSLAPKRQLRQPLSFWGKDELGSHRPLETTAPLPRLGGDVLSLYHERARCQLDSS